MAGLKTSFRRRQTALNGGSAAAAFALSIATGIWFTPYLVGRIGPESYGIIMLAMAITSYAFPLAQGLSITLVVQFAGARASGDPESMQRMFDAAMRLTLRIALVLAAALVPVMLLGPDLLGLAPRFHGEASGILLLTGLALVVWILATPFGAIVYASNRIDYVHYTQILQTVVRVFGGVLLLEWVTRSPLAVPLAAVAAAALSLAWAFGLSRSLSSLRVTPAGVMRARSLPFRGTDAGVLGHSVAFAFLLGSELVIVNYLADELGAGRYAAVIQIAVLVRAAMLNLAGIFGPQVIAHSAEGDAMAAGNATARAMETLGIGAALPAGVALMAAPLILEIWLGPPFADLAGVLQAAMIGTVILVAAMPLYTLEISAHRTVTPAVLRAAAIGFYLLLAVVLFKTTRLGVVSVSLAFAIGAAVFEIGIMAPYAARVRGVAPLHFLRPFAPALLGLGLAAGMTAALLWGWKPASLLELLLFCGVLAVAYSALMGMLFRRAQIFEAIDFLRRRAPGQTS